MKIQENHSLKNHHTFKIDVKAKFFLEIHSVDELNAILFDPDYQNIPKIILGGGSNVLFTRDFPGLVIKNSIGGIEKISENENTVTVEAGGGENWHNFVLYCIDQGWGGIENLSLIPGTVGAAPMQNIGAYGVELKDVFYSLKALEIATGNLHTFYRNDCLFGYRSSIFKTHYKDQYIITSVTLQLRKNPVINISYGNIKATLASMGKPINGTAKPSIKDVSDAVIKIRKSKLPDPEITGNAGSFFKNPEMDIIDYEELSILFPGIPGFKAAGDRIKVPAAWLIDQCSWKGKVCGNAAVHDKQPLVLINKNNATGNEIRNLATKIQKSVALSFGIDLVPEVNII